MQVKFKIPGDPQGKGRPRFTRRGNRSGFAYTPPKTHQYEAVVRMLAVQNAKVQCPETELPISQDCAVEITANFAVPKSYSRKKRKACLSGFIRPHKKPDSDNIAKIVLDGLNPLMKRNRAIKKMVTVAPGFYEDDKQVTKLEVNKQYSEEAGVEVVISWNDE